VCVCVCVYVGKVSGSVVFDSVCFAQTCVCVMRRHEPMHNTKNHPRQQKHHWLPWTNKRNTHTTVWCATSIPRRNIPRLYRPFTPMHNARTQTHKHTHTRAQSGGLVSKPATSSSMKTYSYNPKDPVPTTGGNNVCSLCVLCIC